VLVGVVRGHHVDDHRVELAVSEVGPDVVVASRAGVVHLDRLLAVLEGLKVAGLADVLADPDLVGVVVASGVSSRCEREDRQAHEGDGDCELLHRLSFR
jgi:hypothetical protein